MGEQGLNSSENKKYPHGLPAEGTVQENLIAVLFLVALTGVFFSPWFAGGKVLAPLDWLNQFCLPWATGEKIEVKNHFISDCVTQVLLFRKTGEESFRESGYLGWDDRSLGGSAQYANTTWYAYDWTFQLHRFLEFWPAWHLGLWGQFLLAGLGLYFYLRSIRVPFWAALPCAVSYMWNSHFIHWMYHRHGLGGFCWIPWFLFSLEKWKGGSRSAFGLALASLSFAILGLSLQYHAFLGIVLLGILADGNGATDLKAARWRIFWLILAAAFVTAFMTLPCVQAFLENQDTSNNRGNWGYEGGWSQPVLNLFSYLLYFFPFPLGQTNTLDAWKIFHNSLFDVIYLGSIPLVAGGIGLTMKGCPKRFRFWCLVSLIVSLSPLVGFLYRRVLVVFALGAVCAAGVWLAQASPESLKKAARRLMLTVGIGYVAWVIGSIFLMGEEDLLLRKIYLFMDPASSLVGTRDGVWILERSGRFFHGLLAWEWRNASAVALIFAGGLVLYQQAGHRLSPCAAGILLAAIVAAETAIFSCGWIVWSDPARYPAYSRPRLLEDVDRSMGSGRILLEETSQREEYFSPNTLLASGLSMINGYESIKPRGMSQYYGYRFWDAECAGRMGITHALQKSTSPLPSGWQTCWEKEGVRLLKNPCAFPRYAGLSEVWNKGVEREKVIPLRPLLGLRNDRQLEIPKGVSFVRVAENYGWGWIFKEENRPWRWVVRAQDGSMILPLAETTSEKEVLQLRYLPALSICGGFLGVGLAGLLLFLLFRGTVGRWFLAPW